MKKTLSTIKTLVTQTAAEVKKDKVPTLAAALSFFAVFSVVPGVVLLVTIVGSFLGEETTRAEVISQFQLWLGEGGARFVQSALEARAESEADGMLASLVSVGILLVAATRFFAELQYALNRVWDVEPEEGTRLPELVRKRLLSAVLMATIAVSSARRSWRARCCRRWRSTRFRSER